MAKRVIITVRWNKQLQLWDVHVDNIYKWDETRKNYAVAEAVARAKQQEKATLVIYKKNGRIQEERTYPRKSDPRKSKG